MSPRSPWMLLLAVGTLSACSAPRPAADASDPNSAQVGCQSDARLDSGYVGRSKLGAQQRWTFVLQAAEPQAVLRGTNVWTVQLRDAAGAPVRGASLTVTPRMPDHGHGSSVQPSVQAVDDAYRIDGLYLFMAGIWEVRLEASRDGESDSAVFTDCV